MQEDFDKPHLSQAVADKWVKPFYRSGVRRDADKFVAALQPIYSQLDEKLISTLLSEFNWRPRIVGAYFAAIKNSISHVDLIGKLLLANDVCYAGRGYCLALAHFGTGDSVDFLLEYLNIYLGQTEKYLFQGYAMAALAQLDARHGTDNADKLMPMWNSFAANKTNWDLGNFVNIFTEEFETLNSISRQMPDAN